MFKYDQPTGVSGPVTETSRLGATSPLSDLVQALWRRKIAIVAAGLICACAAVMVGKSLTPRYTATAQLYVDPRELNLVDRELTPRAQDSSAMSMVVESQARLIASNNVLLRVIEDNRLDQDPEFGGPAASGPFGSLLSLVGISKTQTAADKAAARTEALEALNKHLNVKRTDRTYVIDIDVWSNEPAKAAKIANAISNAYLAEARESQSVAARRATSDLSGRLKELQDRLRTAENALAVYKAKNNFVGTTDTLVSDQQLLSGAQRLAAAKAVTLDAQAKYDQIEASRKASTDAGAIPEALQSPTIANLRAQYAESARRLAELKNELGPLHPSLRNMEKQVDDIKRSISQEVGRYAQSAKSDLARARDFEASLTKSLDTQKAQSVDLSQASVRLRELERDVDAGRNVYQSFLKRSRETEEQESLNMSSARIIGEATIPQRRTYPPAMSVIAMVGFLVGALAASGLTLAANGIGGTGVERINEAMASPQAAAPAPSVAIATPSLASPSAPTLTPAKFDLQRILVSPSVVAPPVAAPASAARPVIANLTEADVMRSINGILAPARAPDVTKLGWPTLRVTQADTVFVKAVRQMRSNAGTQTSPKGTQVLAVMGPSAVDERSIVAINVALAAARDGIKVLMIDADPARHALSDKVAGTSSATGKTNWLGFGAKTKAAAIETVNGIAIMRAPAADALHELVAEARSSGRYDLILLDGPAMPVPDTQRRWLDHVDGVIAALSMTDDTNDSTDGIVAALGGSEKKIAGAVLSELLSTTSDQQKAKQYA